MKAILKWRYAVLAVWVAAVVGLLVAAPGMADLVREKGQISVPDGYSSSRAEELLSDLNRQAEAGGGAAQAGDTVLVFHNESGLTTEDLGQVEEAVRRLESEQSELGIQSIMSHFEQAELADQLVADDGKTIMVLLALDWQDRSADEVSSELYRALDDVTVEHYLTSSRFIDADVITSSEEGLKKTEYITVIFILVILFIVFRSAVAPLVPLLSVGVSYLAAQSIVAFMVDWWNFPLSNFTQIFMVAVMFGIGTDYCILLISRYKEELSHRQDKWEAVMETYRTAGKTVVYSGMAVMVGFSAIGLSTFILYQSAAAVAVGVAVLLVALFTLVPFFMVTLGEKLFWPAKGSLEHKPSRLWGAAGAFSMKRPLVTLLLIAIVVAPLMINYSGKLSFNALDELGDDYPSVKGFAIISDSFGPGQSLPTKLIIKHSEQLDSAEGLAMIERISREIVQIPGIDSVRSATRPVGEELRDLFVAEQVKQVDEGLGMGDDGLRQIRDGLSTAEQELSRSAPELLTAAEGAAELTRGTEQLQAGIAELDQGLRQVEQGIRDGSAGAGELVQGLQQAAASAEQLAAVNERLLAGYSQVGTGLGSFTTGYQQIEQSLSGISQGLSGVSGDLSRLAEKYPELQQDPDFLTIQGTVNQLQRAAGELGAGLQELNAQLAGVSASLNQANEGFQQSLAGQQQLNSGLAALVEGLNELQQGILQAADGQGQIVARLPEVRNGLEQISAGQREIEQGFADLENQLSMLTQGLSDSVDGLSQVSGGLDEVRGYLSGLASASDEPMAGWHIPQEVLNDEEFAQVLDTYLSADRQIATLDIVLRDNPYSTESIELMAEVDGAVQRVIAGTSWADIEYGIGGVTGMYADLNQISSADYSRTVILMLVGIAIILLILLKSVIMPLYLIVSLILTYFTSMAITEIIFVHFMGYPGLNWAVPFFAFVILVALGVDYSIFLMDRFNEYRHLPVKEAMILSMKNMGKVIMSAAVILGGTFAAMLPSGVLSLLQIASVTITGLLLYALVIMPLFVPVMVRTFGTANWWPFTKNKEELPLASSSNNSLDA
ncbi:efflux RND transporter permease subunit [Paenibacillus senegalensis]|uniref:efflux RND transporter permease subunit n=1 Tax=Paenibacillus senegalensis TaxID=1465766 RepID=UPI0002883783|nr:MMPL family transporter [Paenibacillus senegalensis]